MNAFRWRFQRMQTPKAETAAGVANAGDAVRLNTASGQTLRALDTASNSVMLTLTVS